MTNSLISSMVDVDAPYVRGSSNPKDDDYNPEWVYYNPYNLINKSFTGASNVCPTLIFNGMQDALVPPGWSTRLNNELLALNETSILALYPGGGHGFDALHWSQYGQSIMYYFERFLILTAKLS